MKAVENIIETPAAQRGKLLRILGVGFGVAVGIGTMVGVGILRAPGPIAALLGSPWLIMLAWTLGGFYCLLGANFVAELATMIPKAGGFYVYTERAFGRFGGFIVGWANWLAYGLAISYISFVFGEYAAGLFAPNLAGGRIVFSVAVIALMSVLNLIGLRSGSATQQLTSFVKALALLAFIAVCFIFGGQAGAGETTQTAGQTAAPGSFFSTLIGFVLAFQILSSAYEGWYAPIYFSEEDTDPAKNLPRSMFGSIALTTTIYLLVNLALLYVLPMARLANSKFAGADALSLIFGERSGQILTVLAMLSFLGTINALLMLTSRTLFGLGREGLFIKKVAVVNAGGTPVYALLITSLFAIFFTAAGSFELLLGVSQFFALVIMILIVVALFVLRRREPAATRPYRTKLYPFAPALYFVFSVLLFFGYIYGNPFPSLYALGILAISYPIFRLIKSPK